jgi:uncharacterized protein YjbI with pentapeptide repeats
MAYNHRVSDEPRPSWWERRPHWQRISIIVGAVVVFILIWWLLPLLLYAAIADEPVRVKAITDTRTALLAGLVGIGALGTFWMNSRNVRLTAKTIGVSEENLRLAKRSQEQSFELAERGHLTDRYSKAIEQLGNDNLDVRLGGIYALEQVATGSPEDRRDRDQATIVEVLSAFVRVHSDPLYQYKASLPKDAPPEPAEQQRQKAADYIAERNQPPVDVQAALTVLGRLPLRPGVRRADLSGATLTEANLDEATLAKANLVRATLTEAHLVEATLTEAHLVEATLTKANLIGATLTEANLAGATLTEANLAGATLTEAWLGWATLTKANLVRAALTKAHLVEATLTEAWLAWANLTEANLARATLTKAHCETRRWSLKP